jgi:RHS repeat-associated protein
VAGFLSSRAGLRPLLGALSEPDGSLVAMFVGSYPYFYHFDALGSTRMLTDESGHITDAYTYDAWGNLLTHDRNSISQPYQYVGQLGYYTHYQDANLPLLQLGVRFYDLEVGRFGHVDPIATDPESAYAYAHDNPISLTDPLGLKSYWDYEKEFLACVGDCLKPAGAGAGVGLGLIIKNCFTRGTWVGAGACAAAMAKAAKEAAAAMRTPGGGMSKAGAVCIGLVEAGVLACEIDCYHKLLR